MNRAPKVISPTHRVAYRFAREYLGRAFDYRLDRRVLRDAKDLINPQEGVGAYTEEKIFGCLVMLAQGAFGWDTLRAIITLRAILWGTPPYIEQYERYIQAPPPSYNQAEVKQWEAFTGRVAYPAIDEGGEGDRMKAIVPAIQEQNKDYF